MQNAAPICGTLVAFLLLIVSFSYEQHFFVCRYNAIARFKITARYYFDNNAHFLTKNSDNDCTIIIHSLYTTELYTIT